MSSHQQTTLDSIHKTPDENGNLISEERLREMYEEQKMSKSEIRKRLGVNRDELFELFDEYDFEERSAMEQKLVGKDTRYRNKEFLKKQYVEKGKSMVEIGKMCDCSATAVSDWLEKHDIDKRYYRNSVKFKLGGRPNSIGAYPIITCLGSCGVNQLLEHRLVLLAEGYSIEKVFGNNNYNVHHRNGHKCDNRPCNLELVHREEHGKKHGHDRWKKWSDDDMQKLIHFMLNVGSVLSESE
jgi:hypothetical protein